jgi:hypothetical protein
MMHPKELNHEEKRKQVLESHLLLEKKRDTTAKGCMVAGGSTKQRGMIDKQDVSSPKLPCLNPHLSSMLKKVVTLQ